MRRFLILAAAALMLVVTACGDSDNGSVDNRVATAVDASKASADIGLGDPSKADCDGKTYTIGYDAFADTQEFAAALRKNLDQVAEQLGCVTLIKLVDNADPATALANVKTFVERKVDGVILFQVVASAQAGIMRVLDQAKIPVIAVAVPAPGATFMSINDYEAGLLAGQALARAYKESGKPGMPWVLAGEFPAGGQLVLDRSNGVVDGIKKALPSLPDKQIVKVDAGASADTGFKAASGALANIPQDATILTSAVNDDAVAGIVQAAKQKGRLGDVMASGMGAVRPSGLKYICQSSAYIGAPGFFPEKWGEYLLPAMLAKIQGRKLPPAIYIPQEFISKANVSNVYPDASC